MHVDVVLDWHVIQTTIDPPPPTSTEANGLTKNIYIGLKVQSVRNHEPHQQIVTHT